MSFAVEKDYEISLVLQDWTKTLLSEFQAVDLFDVSYLSATYRVFLFPGNLQVDLSFAPKATFGSIGPNFKLLWGTAVSNELPAESSFEHLFGLAIHHILRGRISIERAKYWQAEYWISAARDSALTISCLQRGLPTGHARGFDALPAHILATFQGALVVELNKDHLMNSLCKSIDCLLLICGEIPSLSDRTEKIEPQLKELGKRWT